MQGGRLIVGVPVMPPCFQMVRYLTDPLPPHERRSWGFITTEKWTAHTRTLIVAASLTPCALSIYQCIGKSFFKMSHHMRSNPSRLPFIFGRLASLSNYEHFAKPSDTHAARTALKSAFAYQYDWPT